MANKYKKRLCECGAAMNAEDIEFWGECKKCQTGLPISTQQIHDGHNSGAAHDRLYHGDTSKGEC